MLRHFPQQYPHYKSRVKALVPVAQRADVAVHLSTVARRAALAPLTLPITPGIA